MHKNTRLQTQGPDLELLIKEISDIFGKDINQVKSLSRKERLVTCRRIFIHAAASITDATLVNIGLTINRDYSSVIAHKYKVQGWVKVNDTKFMNDLNTFRNKSNLWQQYKQLQSL